MQAASFALSVNVPFAELELPDDNRPNGQAPPALIPLGSQWKSLPIGARRTRFRRSLPIRSRSLFFSSAPPGMQVVFEDGRVLPHRRFTDDGSRWEFSATSLSVDVIAEEFHPAKTALFLSYPKAKEREERLNFRYSGISDKVDFVRGQIQARENSYSGLFLPAPGVAAWDLEVPPSGELNFAPGLVKPEIADGPASDGARLVVELEVGGEKVTLWSREISNDEFSTVRVSLAEWEGQSVRLRMRTTPGKSSVFDYLFVADPVVVSRKKNPSRVFLIFVDTLRPDHLGMYGYQRDTSPALDAFGKQSVLFEQARSVAPWTLPTARSVLTGKHPEFYSEAQTLQGRLREQGWATAMVAGNVYLSAAFDLNRDWGRHVVVNHPDADEQVERAQRWLADHDGRDSLLLLHFMDVHLPYQEPRRYRRLFADRARGGLGEKFHRGDVVRAKPLGEEGRQYVRDRYDNNIRFVDDELGRFLQESVGEDDIVVFFSDHGEEFWEHRGFEHGHTLYDEVLKVPLVIKAPGWEAARVSQPASLLDVVPTVLELLSLPYDGLHGESLVAVATGEEGAQQHLAARKQGFGHPLYGHERWGVLVDNRKFSTHQGRDELYNLAKDAVEERNLMKKPKPRLAARYHADMSAAFERQVGPVLRVWPSLGPSIGQSELKAVLTVPGGVQSAWVGDDPTRRSSASVEVAGEAVTIVWDKGYRGSREVFILPQAGADEALSQVSMTLSDQGESASSQGKGSQGKGKTRWTVRLGGHRVSLGRGVAPTPSQKTQAVDGYDPELATMLRAMGYAVGEDEE